jgi:hypothetical protein
MRSASARPSAIERCPGQVTALAQPDKRQDGENDDDGADEVNDAVHDIFL